MDERCVTPEQFRDSATAAISTLAATGHPFTSDDIWDQIGDPRIWGVEPRTLGPVLQSAARELLIKPTGAKRQPARSSSKNRPIAEWVGITAGRNVDTPQAHPEPPSLANVAWLHRRYLLDGMPVSVLASETGSRIDEVVGALTSEGITVRRGAEDVLTVPVIAWLFIEQGLSASAVGVSVGVGVGTVEVMLSRYGITQNERDDGKDRADLHVLRWRSWQPALSELRRSDPALVRSG